MDLKNKTVLVTGSSSGIGQATAVAFAEKGATVLIHYHKNAEGAKRTLREVEQYSEGRVYQANLADPQSTRAMFKKMKKDVGKIDVLVNNAGYAKEGSLADEKMWKDQFENILMVIVHPTVEFLKMKSKDQRKIVNVSSIYASLNLSNPELMQYSAMKAAVSNFTATVAKELGNKVLVNAVAPGYTWTPAWAGISAKEKAKHADANKIRRFIEPEEIAHVAAMLAENDAITGQVITVDGGLGLQDLPSHE